jgi:hypothetical protein
VKKPLFLQSFLLGFLAATVVAESIEPRNLVEGKVLADSISPDGRYCFLHVMVGGTSASAVVLATTDRARVLAQTVLRTNQLSILWAPDSRRVAVHDALPKHSAVTIYRLAGEQFEALEIHDLLAAACGHWGIPRQNVISSGQRPVEWGAANTNLVMIEVAGRLKDGRRLRSRFGIHAPMTGRSVRQ